jgi:twitching motility protein PilT
MGMAAQLLPEGLRAQLTEFGAVEYELPANPAVSGRFVVIAARGGDDIWLEVRNKKPKPAEANASADPAARAPEPVGEQPAAVEAEAPVEAAPAVEVVPPAPTPAAAVPDLAVIEESVEEAPGVEVAAEAPTFAAAQVPAEPAAQAPPSEGEPPAEAVPNLVVIEESVEEAPVAAEDDEAVDIDIDLDSTIAPVALTPAIETPVPVASAPHEEHEEEDEEVYELSANGWHSEDLEGLVAAKPEPVVEAESEPVAEVEPEPVAEAVPEPVVLSEVETNRPGVVLPLIRGPVRGERPPDFVGARRSTLERLLRVAAARGASALYLVTGLVPVVRVDGEIQRLDGEEALAATDVATMLMELAPEPTAQAIETGVVTEWISDVEGVGRVRGMSFRDHRGQGGIFRMLPASALSVDQLGLSREIQALCRESEGLVLVTGPRSSGKSTLISAFVDLINRSRADHVITLEGQIRFVHESRRSLVSQRELRGNTEAIAAAARAALREDPDVLVIEDVRSAEVMAVALDAAESGRLVFGALSAPSTAVALERVVEQFPPERRAFVLTTLAATLRGVVAQVLIRKSGGGRVAARELLLNTPAVAALVSEGKLFQLPTALESGRKHGCAPLNDALVALVQSGAVSSAEAYRKADDREGLLAQLRREGVDTSFVERLG